MTQTTHGGRAASNRLLDDLAAIDDLAAEMQRDLIPPNIRLIERDLADVRQLVADLRRFVAADLEAILRRRDARTADDMAARLRDLEDRIAILERSHVPERARRGGDG